MTKWILLALVAAVGCNKAPPAGTGNSAGGTGAVDAHVAGTGTAGVSAGTDPDAGAEIDSSTTSADASTANRDASASSDSGAESLACSAYEAWTTAVPPECDQVLWALDLSKTVTDPPMVEMCFIAKLAAGKKPIQLVSTQEFCGNGVAVEETFLPADSADAAMFFSWAEMETGVFISDVTAREFRKPESDPLFVLTAPQKPILLSAGTVLRARIVSTATFTSPGVLEVKTRWELRGY